CGYALDTTFLEDGTIYGHCYHNAIAICCIRLCKVHTPFTVIVQYSYVFKFVNRGIAFFLKKFKNLIFFEG
ncbi:MAG: hypothetical protein WCS25_07140, partial [Victivallaceae bacterium]